MDEYFSVFEKWYKSRIKIWNKCGIIVEKSGLSRHAHQYHIFLASQYGLGEISLYESNGLYWVDFEAGLFSNNEMFFRTNITFSGEESITDAEHDFIQYVGEL